MADRAAGREPDNRAARGALARAAYPPGQRDLAWHQPGVAGRPAAVRRRPRGTCARRRAAGADPGRRRHGARLRRARAALPRRRTVPARVHRPAQLPGGQTGLQLPMDVLRESAQEADDDIARQLSAEPENLEAVHMLEQQYDDFMARLEHADDQATDISDLDPKDFVDQVERFLAGRENDEGSLTARAARLLPFPPGAAPPADRCWRSHRALHPPQSRRHRRPRSSSAPATPSSPTPRSASAWAGSRSRTGSGTS